MNAHAEHGPLPALLFGLTVVTGMVDAVSYLKLGHVFVANMTGNIVFLGLASAGATDVSASASLIATGAFLLGALGGGRLARKAGSHRGRLLAHAAALEIGLVFAALTFVLMARDRAPSDVQQALVALLALAMGLQNATARHIGVPDLSTTVLTLTLTGIAADSALAGGENPHIWRRLGAAGAMCLGAAAGAFCILHAGVAPVLVLALLVLAGIWTIGWRTADSTEDWTMGR